MTTASSLILPTIVVVDTSTGTGSNSNNKKKVRASVAAAAAAAAEDSYSKVVIYRPEHHVQTASNQSHKPLGHLRRASAATKAAANTSAISTASNKHKRQLKVAAPAHTGTYVCFRDPPVGSAWDKRDLAYLSTEPTPVGQAESSTINGTDSKPAAMETSIPVVTVIAPDAKPALTPQAAPHQSTPPLNRKHVTKKGGKKKGAGTKKIRKQSKGDNKPEAIKEDKDAKDVPSQPKVRINLDDVDLFNVQAEIAQLKEEEAEAAGLLHPEDGVDFDNGDGSKGYDSEEEELELQKRLEASAKNRDPELDRARMEAVVKAFQNHVSNKMPVKLENKWHLWKYVELDPEKREAAARNQIRKKVIPWMDQTRDTSEEVGWGRRIYEKTEIENEDKERERMLFDDESVRHLNMKKKEVAAKYGLWDVVYDKRVVRTLDCNAKWAPNRKEMERRKKVAKKELNAARRKANKRRSEGDSILSESEESSSEAESASEEDSDDSNDDVFEDDDEKQREASKKAKKKKKKKDPFKDAREKWAVPTGEKLTKVDLLFCEQHTNFKEDDIRKWFISFREECPTGKLTRSHLHSLFKRIFPGGDSESFCNHIFRIFDSDLNGFLDFKEFLMALDVTACRSEKEKLEWAFRLYDVDSSGSINRREIAAILHTIDQVEGRLEYIDCGTIANSSSRANDLFTLLDADHDGEVSLEEFVEGYLKFHTQMTVQLKAEERERRVKEAREKEEAERERMRQRRANIGRAPEKEKTKDNDKEPAKENSSTQDKEKEKDKDKDKEKEKDKDKTKETHAKGKKHREKSSSEGGANLGKSHKNKDKVHFHPKSETKENSSSSTSSKNKPDGSNNASSTSSKNKSDGSSSNTSTSSKSKSDGSSSNTSTKSKSDGSASDAKKHTGKSEGKASTGKKKIKSQSEKRGPPRKMSE